MEKELKKVLMEVLEAKAEMRHLLGLVDLADIEEKEMSETERDGYCQQIYQVFALLEKDILQAIKKQMILTFKEADNMDKLALGQGSVNGMTLLYQKWQQACSEYEAKQREKTKPENINNPLPEL